MLQEYLKIILSLCLVTFGFGCAAVVFNESGLLMGDPHRIDFSNGLRLSNEEKGTEEGKVFVSHNCTNIDFLSFGPQVLILPLPIIPWPLGLFSFLSGQSLTSLKEKVIELRIEVFPGGEELSFEPNEVNMILPGLAINPHKWTQRKIFRYQAGVEYNIWFEATCSDVEGGVVYLDGMKKNGLPFSVISFNLPKFESKIKMRDSLPLMHGLYD